MFWRGTKGKAIIGVLFVATALCTFASEHETSKLAILAAALIYLVSRLSLPAAKGMLLAGWAVAILATVPIAGVPTDVVMVAGKMGKAYAYRAADGKHLWTRSVGKHRNDTGKLPRSVIDG